jgi:hypothetical protein
MKGILWAYLRAKCGSDGVTSTLDGELDDIFTVEIVGIFRETGAGGVFDALIDRKNRHIAGATEAAVPEQALEIRQDAHIAVGNSPHTIDELWPG